MSQDTEICGIIGDPIGHSMSPIMHNAAFKKMGLDFIYLPFRVKSKRLGKAIAGMRALNIRGLNVTIPHKVAVIPFLDSLDPLAEKIGAVNTIVNTGGILKGCNTDAAGFMQALLEKGGDPAGKNAVVIGAGGASRAVSFILAERVAQLTILNRQLELTWAEELANRLNKVFKKEAKALELTEQNLANLLPTTDILINATSVGMSPNVDDSPVPEKLFKPNLTVFDLVYNPVETRLLREAKQAGAKTISGVDMLVCQGAISFEYWTDVKAPVELMKEEVIKALGGKGYYSEETKKDALTNIALIGFMGTGKTAAGKALAERLNRKFVEMDSLIKQRAGKSIPEMFSQDGEIAFRELEIEVAKEISKEENQVIACGGGVVLNKINIDRLKTSSVVIYLTASQDVILKRILADGESRPLLNVADKEAEIQRLLQFRKPFYEAAADITVDTSYMDIPSVAEEIASELEDYEGFHQ